MGWRWPDFLSRVWSRPASTDHRDGPIADPWPVADEAADRIEAPVALKLSEIEAAACAVYVRHGLPNQPGQYALSPKSGQWRFLSADMTVEERWALVLAQREGAGWRFGSLEDLGDGGDSPADLKRAAQALRACRQIRDRLAGRSEASVADDLALAIDLGAAWIELRSESTTIPRIATASVKPLAAPKPRAKRKPSARPKA